MDELVSIFSVVGFWIALSTSLWWLHRRRTHSRLNRQIAQARQARTHTQAAQAVFDRIRAAAFEDGVIANNDELERETFALLRRLQENQPFFDTLTTLCAQIRRSMKRDECPPLSELMHIRRDLWAASEIVLMDDMRVLGEDAGDAENLEKLRSDAATVMFKGVSGDPIDLRLGIAREEAEKFVTDVDEVVRLAREADRLPSFGEIMSYPLAALRAVPRYARAFAAYIVRFARYVRALARRMRESETLARGVHELNRARETLPRRIAEGAGKASVAAQQGAAVLRRHYTFLVTAHDLRAKYERLLSRRAEIPERGRQFLARLEAEARSERLRLTWANAVDWLKRRIVHGLAHLIAALERLREQLDEVNAGIMRKAVAALAAAKRPALPAPSPGHEAENQPAPVVFLNPVTRAVAATLMSRLASTHGQAATGAAPSSASVTDAATGDGLPPSAHVEEAANDDTPDDDIPTDDVDGDSEEPGPLTRRVLEVQAKLAAKPQFPGFPWMRR